MPKVFSLECMVELFRSWLGIWVVCSFGSLGFFPRALGALHIYRKVILSVTVRLCVDGSIFHRLIVGPWSGGLCDVQLIWVPFVRSICFLPVGGLFDVLWISVAFVRCI